MQFLDPKVDMVFKRLFGSEDHKSVTIAFLNTMLEYTGRNRIVSIEFNNTEQLPVKADKKENILDVFCTDKKGRKFIIEMQNAWMKAFDKRIVYYGAKVYTNQLNAKKPYDDLDPVTVVAITKKFNLFSKSSKYKSILTINDKTDPVCEFPDLAFACVELAKFNKQENELVTKEDKWIFLLKEIAGYERIPEALQQDEFREACDVLNKITWTDAEQAAYEKQLLDAQAQEINDDLLHNTDRKMVRLREEGREEGIEEGIEKGRKETAKNLLLMGVDISFVKQATGLTEEEIEALR